MKMSVMFFLCMMLSTGDLSAFQLLKADDFFAPHELEDIIQEKNFFHYRDIDNSTPIWVNTNRKYSHHVLGQRTHVFSMKDVVHKVLTDGFPIQYRLEELYRARLGIHSQVGQILPQLSLNVADAAQMGLSNVFSNVFAFILPGNWLKLANEALIYKVTKTILLKSVLDQIFDIKMAYLDVHQMIIDFEVLNYYYVHLQVLIKCYNDDSVESYTILGYLGVLGNLVASKRAELRIAFDVLAKFMALEKFSETYTAGTLNIKEIENFPKHLHELEDHESHIKDREAFIQEVVRRSLELDIVKQFYKISKLNVGITASGGTISVGPGPGLSFQDSRFALSVGYGNIPNILIAKSFSRTAKIDVQNGYIDILTTARMILDRYSNALSKYAEAKQALELNRMSLKKSIDNFVKKKIPPDGNVIFSLFQLVNAEITINDILHDMFRAKAGLRRYLLKDKEEALEYLPTKGAIIKKLVDIKGEKIEEIRKELETDSYLKNIKETKQLEKVLYHHESIKLFENLSRNDMDRIIERNMGNLLFSKFNFYKSRNFYRVLQGYVDERSLNLTPMELFMLKKKQSSRIKRFFQKKSKKYKGDYLHNFDFKNFGKD